MKILKNFLTISIILQYTNDILNHNHVFLSIDIFSLAVSKYTFCDPTFVYLWTLFLFFGLFQHNNNAQILDQTNAKMYLFM